MCLQGHKYLKETEVVAPGTSNTIWTADKKGNLNLKKSDDLQAYYS